MAFRLIKNVCIHIEGGLNICMAEHIAHDRGIHALRNQQACTLVAQIVEANIGQASSLQQRLECAYKVARAHRCSNTGGKDQAVILPGCAELQALLQLALAVCFQG